MTEYSNLQNVEKSDNECSYKEGTLPKCAPLSVGYVPWQESSTPQYKSMDAFARGTLFPGLDLPWKNVVNRTEAVDTPHGELMALHFVITELGMYLDTHKNDREGLEIFQKYVKLYKEGYERYVKLYGPLDLTDVTGSEFSWVNNPWPWDLVERMG